MSDIHAPIRERWRRLSFTRGITAPLLAGVEGLLAGLATAREPTVRWYVMEHPSLILGSSQRLTEVDVAACHAEGVTIYQRRSGGTAVYSDATLLSLDVALPNEHRLLPANITEAYRWFGEVWQIALQTLGITCHVLSDAEARATNSSLDPAVRQVCFGGVSPYEVLVDDRKLVGLAQIRRRSGGLLQAGIYTRWQPDRISHLLPGTAEQRRARADLLAGRAYGLDQVGGAGITFAELMLAWEQALSSHIGVELYDGDWTASERSAIVEVKQRYAALPAPESPNERTQPFETSVRLT